MKTDNKLLPHLQGHRLLSSAELIGCLRADGISDANARQILSRQRGLDGIWRSEKLRLARNERLFASQRFFGTEAFLRAAGEKLRQTHRWGLARVLATLADRQVIHKVDILRLLAVSLQADAYATQAARRAYESERAALEELGIKVIQRDTAMESLASPLAATDTADELAAAAAVRVRREAVLSRVLTDRLRRENMMAWNQVESADFAKPYAIFNNHVFSASGFSYLSPVRRWNQEKNSSVPCPVVIDCYADDCNLFQVESFVQRIERVSNRGKSKLPVLAVIAARDFQVDAWKEAKSRGFVTINFRQHFGNEALDAMIAVESVLSDLSRSGSAPSTEFSRFSDLLKELQANPVVVTLRSLGFEALAGLILRSKGYEQVELGRIVPWKHTERDIDVFGILDGTLYVIECKAYYRKKSLLEEDVTKFYGQTLPALKAWLRSNSRHFERCVAEIWTTGPTGKVAGDKLYQLKSPKLDAWSIKRLEDLKTMIPKDIRRRSLELLESIAMTDSGETVDP